MATNFKYKIFGEYMIDYRPHKCQLTDRVFDTEKEAKEYLAKARKNGRFCNAIDIHVRAVAQ